MIQFDKKSRLPGEKTDARDGIHERNVDFYSLGDQVLYFTEHGEVVFGLDIIGVGGVQAGDETS